MQVKANQFIEVVVTVKLQVLPGKESNEAECQDLGKQFVQNAICFAAENPLPKPHDGLNDSSAAFLPLDVVTVGLTYKDDAVYDGDVLMGEFDGNEFVPSKLLLERPANEHKRIDRFVNKIKRHRV